MLLLCREPRRRRELQLQRRRRDRPSGQRTNLKAPRGRTPRDRKTKSKFRVIEQFFGGSEIRFGTLETRTTRKYLVVSHMNF